MASTDLILLVSLLLLLVGMVLMFRQVGRRMREIAQRKHRIVEEPADIACQSIFFGALALMQLGQLIGHVSKGKLPPDPWLSLIASTLIFLLFGASLGRLLMRWQLRQVLAELDIGTGQPPERSGQVTARKEARRNSGFPGGR
jgi:UPF0716 family protein affecting phage T7 exclusion